VLERSKHVLDRPPPYRHGVKLTIQSALHRLKNRFVFPSPNASVGSRGALALEGAGTLRPK
jgi:hypothetical protein